MENFDTIIAGAGIWGCTVARRLAEAGKRVLVLEKRSVVGGNVRCEIDPGTGIEVHTYGSHIFHTHLPEVWQFVNRFVKFNGYQHKVLAKTKKIGGENRWTADGKCLNGDSYHLYHLPLGLTLINKFFGVELRPSEVAAFMADEKHSSAIFDAFFRGYTSKQWGKAPEEIDPSIIKRVPVRSNYDTNYFNDYWQGIPSEGYNTLFERLLEHPNIEVETEMMVKMAGTDLRAVRNPDSTQHALEIDFGRAGRSPLPVYYSGPIDALFDYKFGALPWRTLQFETERVPVADYQGTSVVNYTDADVPYTRIHEFKHYHPEPVGPLAQAESIKTGKETIIMREYSAQWKQGDEPYYPINTPESAALLAKYQAEVEWMNQTFKHSNIQTVLTIGGRLGQYKYYDMDKSIDAALKVEI